MGQIEEYSDDWIMEGCVLCVWQTEVGSKASDIQSMKLIAQSISYAKKLEHIV